jgi:dTMP kinase
VDGSGKTTQAHLLATWYRAQGFTVVETREPGGTSLGEQLRAVILDATVPCAPRAELLMILAARAQHVAEVIAPALAAGQIVVCDRFTPSSLAYQGGGRGLPEGDILAADAAATGGLAPDLTILTDVSLEAALARIGARADRFEGEGRAFLQRVIDHYRAQAAGNPRMVAVDGTASVEDVHRAIVAAVIAAGREGGHAA